VNPTAQPIMSPLSQYNRRYLALRVQIDREKSRFTYRPDLIEQLQAVRNRIVELQNNHRKGGDQQWI
jgi:hypothetical protein